MNLPDPPDLLAIARETLLRDIRPQLNDEGRHAAAMIANAMAIAARALEAADESPDRRHERQLAADIRAGRYDLRDERQRAMLEELRASVIARLRISNPKSLPPE
jgi:hypothetical protein